MIEPPETAKTLANQILASHGRWIQSLKRVSAEPSNRASELGHPCLRYLVLLRTHGNLRALPSDETQQIFQEGHEVEVRVKRMMGELGFDLQGAQQDFPANAYQITGHVDGKIAITNFKGTLKPGSTRWVSTEWVLIEIKGVNGSDFDRIVERGISHIVNNSRAWLAKWYTQAQLYCYLADIPGMVFVFKNKWRGGLHALPMGMDLDYVEKLLDKAETINAHIAAKTLPDFLTDPNICRTCPFFGRVCDPPLDFGPGVQILQEESMLEEFERYEELSAEIGGRVREFLRLEKKCKDYVRSRAGSAERVIAGNTLARITRGEKAGHYTPPTDTVRITLEPLKGTKETDAGHAEESVEGSPDSGSSE